MSLPKPSVQIPTPTFRRENDRFCTFVLNSKGVEYMSRLFTYGAFIADRGDIDGTAKQICVPLQYGNNTYRFDLKSLSDEEYEMYNGRSEIKITIPIHKTDSDKNPLEKAEFTLKDFNNQERERKGSGCIHE